MAVGGGALGIGTLASSNLPVGNHTVAVTQASAGATLTATAAPAASTVITAGSNDTLTYNLDGGHGVTHHSGRDLHARQLGRRGADGLGRPADGVGQLLGRHRDRHRGPGQRHHAYR